MEERRIARGRSHKIKFIFKDIDRMAIKNSDLERSRAVIEKQNLVLHLNVF